MALIDMDIVVVKNPRPLHPPKIAGERMQIS
jgi:hypothetical protein